MGDIIKLDFRKKAEKSIWSFTYIRSGAKVECFSVSEYECKVVVKHLGEERSEVFPTRYSTNLGLSPSDLEVAKLAAADLFDDIVADNEKQKQKRKTFAEIAEENRKNAERIKKERSKNNELTLKSYRLT